MVTVAVTTMAIKKDSSQKLMLSILFVHYQKMLELNW